MHSATGIRAPPELSSAPVAIEHHSNLRHRHVRLIDDEQPIAIVGPRQSLVGDAVRVERPLSPHLLLLPRFPLPSANCPFTMLGGAKSK